VPGVPGAPGSPTTPGGSTTSIIKTTTNTSTGLGTITQTWATPHTETGATQTKTKTGGTPTYSGASASGSAALGDSPASFPVNLTGEQSDVPGWVNMIILLAWLIAGGAVLAFARMLVVDRRKIQPARHRAGLTTYRLGRVLYRLGPVLLPLRLLYRVLVVSFSWVKVPPPDRPVTMWQYGHPDGVHQA
jgi:hypothetical protein